MNKIPTIQELLTEEASKYTAPIGPDGLTLLVHNVARKVCEFHIQAALEAAYNNAEVVDERVAYSPDPSYAVKKDSILNAYPLEKIQ